MTDEPHHLMLRMPRGIDTKMVEEGVAGVNRRLDRADARLDRMERQLNLSEGVT